MRTCFIILSAVISFFAFTTGKRCDNQRSPDQLADFQPRQLFSPGYPENYEVNDNCTWIISPVTRGEEYALQVVTQEMDLHDPRKDCSSDYLAAYEGDVLLAKWCGNEHKMVKTSSTRITLFFHSDGQYTGKGFVLTYSLVKFTPAKCDDSGKVPVIEVMSGPVYESFKGSAKVKRCEWEIKSFFPEKKLVFELFKPSAIRCPEGAFNFYDGENKNGHVAFRYCSSRQPFSTMYMSNNKATIVFEYNHGLDSEPDDLVLKISARNTTYMCTDSEMPTIEVHDGPVMFSLPFTTDQSGNACPVRLWTRNEDNVLRLDVMGTSEGEADCNTDVVRVKGALSEKNLMKLCNRNINPVYYGTMHDQMEIKSKVESSVFLRASEMYWVCSGQTRKEVSYDDLVKEYSLPKKGGYPNFSKCRILITTENEGASVVLGLRWTPPVYENRIAENGAYGYSETGDCKGDFINIYDGNNESAPLLFSTCQHDEARSFINKMIYSTQRNLLLIMDADAQIPGESFIISFHSIPGGKICSGPDEVKVTRTPHVVSSLNYPGPFPRNQKCVNHLVSENPEDEIVIKVLVSKLGFGCESVLIVYEGKYEISQREKVANRICGRDTPTITVASDRVSLVTYSEDYTGPGGWQVETYTRKKSMGSAGDTTVCNFIILSVILAIALAL